MEPRATRSVLNTGFYSEQKFNRDEGFERAFSSLGNSRSWIKELKNILLLHSNNSITVYNLEDEFV